MGNARTVDLNAAIFDGVTVNTLGDIFGHDTKEVNRRMAGRVQPVKSKDNFVRYRIRDAAPYLVESNIDPEEMFKNMSPAKWPATLQKAFWEAQNSKMKWEEARGDLWRTQRVYEVITGAFKVIRLTILMFVDTIDQRTELSSEQRRILQELGDGLLATLHKTLEEEFAFHDAKPDEHGTPLNEDVAILDQELPEEKDNDDPFA